MEQLRNDITEIKVTLGQHTLILERNTEDLKIHMMRTELLQTLVTDIANLHKALKLIAVSVAAFVTFAGTVAALYKIFVP